MAVTHWETGESTETTACVVVRADATGNVPVMANGVTLQATCDTGVADGNARVDFTGLQPGTSYAYTVNGSAGGTLRTKPAGYPYWLAFSSCWAIAVRDAIAPQLLRAPLSGANRALHQEMVERLAGFFPGGDLVYMNLSTTINGYALQTVEGGTLARAKDVAVRNQYYRAGCLVPGLKELMRSCPTYKGKDDHEYDPDNASLSTSWLDAAYPATAPHSGTDLSEVWAAATTAWRNWALGNPARTLASDYFTVSFPGLDVIVTDLIHGRDYPGLADSASKRMLAAEDEAALLADIAADGRFKVWGCSKQFISSCGRNADGWYDLPGAASAGYQAQLARILGDARFPRAGALSITGDEHIESDLWVSETRFGGPHAAISQISAGPASIDVITDPDDGLAYTDGVRNKERDTSSGARRGNQNYVLLRVLADRVERYRLGTRSGLVYLGYVDMQDNRVKR